jgi:hypothetical protein
VILNLDDSIFIILLTAVGVTNLVFSLLPVGQLGCLKNIGDCLTVFTFVLRRFPRLDKLYHVVMTIILSSVCRPCVVLVVFASDVGAMFP